MSACAMDPVSGPIPTFSPRRRQLAETPSGRLEWKMSPALAMVWAQPDALLESPPSDSRAGRPRPARTEFALEMKPPALQSTACAAVGARATRPVEPNVSSSASVSLRIRAPFLPRRPRTGAFPDPMGIGAQPAGLESVRRALRGRALTTGAQLP